MRDCGGHMVDVDYFGCRNTIEVDAIAKMKKVTTDDSKYLVLRVSHLGTTVFD
jgi:hypothetical protein